MASDETKGMGFTRLASGIRGFRGRYESLGNGHGCAPIWMSGNGERIRNERTFGLDGRPLTANIRCVGAAAYLARYVDACVELRYICGGWNTRRGVATNERRFQSDATNDGQLHRFG